MSASRGPSRSRTAAGHERGWLGAVLLVAAIVVFFAVPAFANASQVLLLTQGLCFALAVLGLDLMLGQTGMLSFGQAAWFGVGGYTSALFAKHVSSDVVLATVVTAVGVGLAAFLLGLVIVRLQGVGFAIMTLIIAQIFFTLALKLRGITGGEDGLGGIPVPSILGTELFELRQMYWMALVLLIVAVASIWALMHTPFGRTLNAIRENHDRALLIGVNVRLHRAVVFGIAGALAAVAGGLSGFTRGVVSPDSMTWLDSGTLLLMAILGGVGTIFGPVVAAIVWVLVHDWMIERIAAWELPFGIFFIAMVILLPKGIGGMFTRRRDRREAEESSVLGLEEQR